MKAKLFKKIKKIAAALLTFILIFVIAGGGTAAEIKKDETVYVMLNHNGSVQKIDVVNRLYSDGGDAELADYGEYTDIKNLTNASEYKKEGEKIVWPDGTTDRSGFFYQGTLTADLPFKLDIDYQLNGVSVPAEELAGAGGRIQINIDISPNEQCPEKVREGLMAQITLPLSLNKAKNIQSEGAVKVVSGQAATLSYTVLPGASATFQTAFDAADFEMQRITTTLTNSTIALPESIEQSVDEIKSGFSDMTDGMNDMIDGTTELKSGLTTVKNNARTMSGAVSGLSRGISDLQSGINDYAHGISKMAESVPELDTGSQEISSGLLSLSSQSDALITGFSGIESGLNSLNTGHSQLAAIATNLIATSTDPNVLALAQGVLDESAAISSLAGGIQPLNAGLNDYTGGVDTLAGQYADFHAGIQALSANTAGLDSGIKEISSGMDALAAGAFDAASGMQKFHKGTKSLPGDVGVLIDGQKEFKEGLTEANDEMEEKFNDALPDDTAAPVSFASPDKNDPSTVQYIMYTPAIEKPEAKKINEQNQDKKSIWQLFLDLFRTN